MAPPGTKVVMHVKPTQRSSWAYHGEDGFYTDPALEYYRCVQCLNMKTRQIKIVDTVQFFPHSTPFPEVTLNDRLTTALDDIIDTLQTPSFQTHNPSLQLDNQTQMALRLIAGILQQIIPVAPPPLFPTKLPPNISNHSPPHSINIPQVPRVHDPKLNTVTHPRVLLNTVKNNLTNKLLHIYNQQTGKKETLRSLLQNDKTKLTWAKAASVEYGRLMLGNSTGTIGTDTMEPVKKTRRSTTQIHNIWYNGLQPPAAQTRPKQMPIGCWW